MVVLQDPESLSSSPKCGNPAQQSQHILSDQLQNSISPPPYVDYQIVPQSVAAAASEERSEPAEKRFFKALLVALSIWILVGIFVSSAFGLPNSTRRVSFRQESLCGFGFVMLKTEYCEG